MKTNPIEFKGASESRLLIAMKIALIILITSMVVVGAIRGTGTMAIYYVPFQIETYEAITQSTIKDRASYRWELTDSSRQRKLLEILSSAGEGSRIGDKRIRLLVVADKREIFVDAEGNVLDLGKTHKLDQRHFQELRTMMSELVSSPGTEKKKR
jgi:hypothetical protein